MGLLLGLGLDDIDDAPMLPRHLIVGHGDGRRSPAELIDGYGTPHASRLGPAARRVVVTTPRRKAVLTVARARDLAEELGIRRILVVGNRVRDERDTTGDGVHQESTSSDTLDP